MNDYPADPIGAAWLIKTYGVILIGRLPVLSQVGGRRTTEAKEGYILETYPKNGRPAAESAAHLQFHLRHEVPHLEFLARLFAQSGPAFVQAWVEAEPTGQYARRGAFLYEWLTGEILQVPQQLAGNYVDAIDSAKLVAASSQYVVKVPRWRINDNLPGTRYFCPMMVKTEAFCGAADLDVSQLFGKLTAEFGEHLLMRAASWLTLKESKASFAIEGESDRTTRIQRFAEVMATRTGQGELPLSNRALIGLQRDILGDKTTLACFGVRQSPVFVGETLHYQEVVHYVAPSAADVHKMLEGLCVFFERTQGQSPVMRSAAVAFGFVYIHPLADGNGRVHRFLINDVLRRDGEMPDPVIFPVSAAITDDASERRRYDQVLESVSRPLMQAVQQYVAFEHKHTRYPDGIVSNLNFSGEEHARPLWRYLDLGPHVVFMSSLIARTLTQQMPEEARYLYRHRQARQALKEIVEMPDLQAERVLRSMKQNQGELSNVLAKEIPILREPGVWPAMIEAVSKIFAE